MFGCVKSGHIIEDRPYLSPDFPGDTQVVNPSAGRAAPASCAENYLRSKHGNLTQGPQIFPMRFDRGFYLMKLFAQIKGLLSHVFANVYERAAVSIQGFMSCTAVNYKIRSRCVVAFVHTGSLLDFLVKSSPSIFSEGDTHAVGAHFAVVSFLNRSRLLISRLLSHSHCSIDSLFSALTDLHNPSRVCVVFDLSSSSLLWSTTL